MSFYATFDGGEGQQCSVSAPHDDEAGRRAGLTSNPHSEPIADAAGDRIKAFSACAMQAVIYARNAEVYRFTRLKAPSPEEIARHADAMRNFATALTQLESGKMFAVNGIAATLADRPAADES